MIADAPPQMQEGVMSLPNQNVGTLYATIKTPYLPIYIEYKVPVWGQVCDGRDHKDAVHGMLYNEFPNHGKGYTYISWRAVPDNPEANKYPRVGKIENPTSYNGDY